MPAGTCDPASRGAAYNEGEQAFGTGGSLSYRYGWDGTSIRPDCVGPLLQVRVVNGNPETWYAHFKGRRGKWQRIVLDAGVTRTYTQAQLEGAGFADNTDLDEMFLTTDPNPPINQFAKV